MGESIRASTHNPRDIITIRMARAKMSKVKHSYAPGCPDR
jgi:hypothetical protein